MQEKVSLLLCTLVFGSSPPDLKQSTTQEKRAFFNLFIHFILRRAMTLTPLPFNSKVNVCSFEFQGTVKYHVVYLHVLVFQSYVHGRHEGVEPRYH